MNDGKNDHLSRDSQSLDVLGYARSALAVPRCFGTDPDANALEVLRLWREADAQSCEFVAFPELALSSYTARDLFLDRAFQASCQRSLAALIQKSTGLNSLALIGLPYCYEQGLYNCVAAIQDGELLALIPKQYLPNYREFEEKRWFRSGQEIPDRCEIELEGKAVPFGSDLILVGNDQLRLGIEICEDAYVPLPPSMFQVLAGATVIANCAASNFIVGKGEARRRLVQSLAERGQCAYLYVAAGPGESSSDLAFDADALVCELGEIVAESQRFSEAGQLIAADIDLDAIMHERMQVSSFADNRTIQTRRFRTVAFRRAVVKKKSLSPLTLLRRVDPHPFVPKDPQTLDTRCWEVFEIQSNALLRRMRAAKSKGLVLGLSGGIDSSHAALVCAAALDRKGLPRKQLQCVGMPGLGTSAQTKDNALKLAASLGASWSEIDIRKATQGILQSSAHPSTLNAPEGSNDDIDVFVARLEERPELADIALENTQARLRTLFLMTLANQSQALVVGTGDLSEKALGWSTYAGDQISMYDVNAGVPKTLIQHVIRWVAQHQQRCWLSQKRHSETNPGLSAVLEAILATPISPELLPNTSQCVAQLTEESIGPYELHDFFLYHLVWHGASPTKIQLLAQHAFDQRYNRSEINRWLTFFYRRFFNNQFKRSCTPDGPKTCAIALSPRGDWRMPSDADVQSWLQDLQ